MRERRHALGGPVPERKLVAPAFQPSASFDELFEEFYRGTDGRKASTTMVFVRLLSKLLRDRDVGQLVVPIVPDEARTFGMEALFRQVGIYSHVGQLYEPVDMDTLLYYKEATNGQIFEEGITEAGSLSSFIAAGTAYATHGVNTIPFFIFYSMFGLQRVGDLAWAAGDMRTRGFLLGGTSGRTTLAGEGLQHQDGQSHLLALPIPNCRSYDPAYAYELAAIIQDGIRRMYGQGESVFYYLTVMNEQYAQPSMPDGAATASCRGCTACGRRPDRRAGTAPSSSAAAPSCRRWSRPRSCSRRSTASPPTCGASRATPSSTVTATRASAGTCCTPRRSPACRTSPAAWPTRPERSWPRPITSRPCRAPSTGGCRARSWHSAPTASGAARAAPGCARFFEVDHRFVTVAALHALARERAIEATVVERAMKDLEIDPGKADRPSPRSRAWRSNSSCLNWARTCRAATSFACSCSPATWWSATSRWSSWRPTRRPSRCPPPRGHRARGARKAGRAHRRRPGGARPRPGGGGRHGTARPNRRRRARGRRAGERPGGRAAAGEVDEEPAKGPAAPAKPEVPAVGPVEFRLPELGENVPGGDVLHVLVRPGDVVARDQPVIELETDKATIEVPSAVAGRVTEVRVKEGDAIKVGDVVFVAQATAGPPARPAPIKVQRVNVSPRPRPPASPVPIEDKPGMLADAIEEARAEVATGTRRAFRRRHRPRRSAGRRSAAGIPARAGGASVRRAARELGVDIGQVPGTGPGGRVSVDDVKAT